MTPAADSGAGAVRSRGWRFGPFTLDVTTGELTRDGETVRLQDKPFEVLVALIEARGALVTREALHERLWPGVVVDFEGSLNAAVRRLRDALRDPADHPVYVETVPRRGYRFLVPAEPVGEATPASAGAAASVARDPAMERIAARKKFLSGAALGLALVATFAAVLLAVVSREPAGGEKRTLLVMPFVSIGTDSSNAFLGEGLGDELIVRLGQLDPLRLGVIARTSARRFADAGHTPGDAPRVLGAQFVLEGTVQREGGRVRVTASLIQGRDQTQLWSEAYDRELTGVLALQREIAAEVAGALALRLLPGDREGAVVPAAYEATLRGRHYLGQQTPEGFQHAAAAFREALQADSTYAPAWAGLADTYALVGIYDFLPPREVFPLARAAAQRALAIDSTRAEAWTSLALIQGAFDWDAGAAEGSIRRALALNPSHAEAHQMYALLLAATGRMEESFREIDRALALDPLSRIVNADRGWLLFLARRYDDASLQLMATLRLDPHFYVAHDNLAWVNFVKGDDEGAIHHVIEALALSGHTREELAAYRTRYERLGWQALRRENAEGMVRDAREGYVSPYDIALEFAAAGDAEEALAWLERSFERREVDLLMLRLDPRLDAVRGQPGFEALVGRVGLSAAGGS